MTKTITITKTIPAPPDGWEYQDRFPNKDEEFMGFDFIDAPNNWIQCRRPPIFGDGCYRNAICAYRIRDLYAERYEALKLPDGWAWIEEDDGCEWSNRPDIKSIISHKFMDSIRRIVNGKAVKP